jgi:heat shock protein HtpX
MKRILLFIGTNIAVLALISILASLFGVDHYLTRTGLNYKMLLGYAAIVGFSGSLFSLAISKWIAKWSYGIQVIEQPSGEAQVWLFNKVKELSKKAGVAMPEIGVYESEEVNAFATGPTRNNALVAVSSGLIHNMSPRQIEGVLAHEMSHIANGDMVTMTLLQGVLNTFVVFFSKIIGFAIDQALRRNDDERSGPGWGYAIGSLVAQIVLGIFASMIVMAYSRHREFRADAMAAQLEGKDAMIGALQRLQQIMGGGGVLDDRSAAVSAFKINNHSDGLMALFASHPPLEARIAALENMR